MPTFHPALSDWLRTHHGVVAWSAAQQLDLSRHTIDSLVGVGELIRLYDGVYRHRMWPDTLESQCAGACAADERIVVCCGGAGVLWDFRRCSALSMHVTSTSSGLHLPGGPLHHRCALMPTSHVHDRGDGIRVTSPARTIFDLAKHVSSGDLESIIEQGLRRNQFDIPTLQEIRRLVCRQGRRGSERFATVLDSRPVWRRAVDSHPELVLRAALATRGVALDTQLAVALPGGRTIHPDLGCREIGFYIEIDDHEWHSSRLATKRDAQRDRALRLAGARIERVSTDELNPASPLLLSALATAFDQQRRFASSETG